jgi:hypothetical protein
VTFARRLGALLAVAAVCGCTGTTARPIAPSPTAPGSVPADTSAVTAVVTSVLSGTTTAPEATTTAPGTEAPTTIAPTDQPLSEPTSAPGPADGSVLALDLLGTVRVENEHRGGYVRDLFGYPADFGHGCDTRAKVLERDSTTTPAVKNPGCTVLRGTWRSPYDGVTATLASALQIDHVVALKEAWDSGAWAWSAAKRHAFANDVLDPRTLRAASIATNQDKGDKDPSNWLPPDSADLCSYVADWVEIKARWGLSMDSSEFGRVRNLLRGPCAGARVAAFTPVPAELG